LTKRIWTVLENDFGISARVLCAQRALCATCLLQLEGVISAPIRRRESKWGAANPFEFNLKSDVAISDELSVLEKSVLISKSELFCTAWKEHKAKTGQNQKSVMLSYSLIFLVIAIIAGFFGFAGVAGTAAWIAQVLFVIFIVLFVLSFFFRRTPPSV
jgi:uncharacterized membrane protein YtjA (UPF0391 family)